MTTINWAGFRVTVMTQRAFRLLRAFVRALVWLPRQMLKLTPTQALQLQVAVVIVFAGMAFVLVGWVGGIKHVSKTSWRPATPAESLQNQLEMERFRDQEQLQKLHESLDKAWADHIVRECEKHRPVC